MEPTQIDKYISDLHKEGYNIFLLHSWGEGEIQINDKTIDLSVAIERKCLEDDERIIKILSTMKEAIELIKKENGVIK